MNITERMLLILKEKKLKASDLANFIGTNQSNISTWKKRNTNPPSEYILQICEFLDVSVEYLLGGECSKRTEPCEMSFADNCILPSEIDLTEDERELLGMYGFLSFDGKKWVRFIIKEYLKENENLLSSRGYGGTKRKGEIA